MKMNEEKVYATIEDCKTCSQDFIKSIHNGNVTSKLRRSKVLDGGEHRVLTIHSSICGDHQTSLKLSYVYSLASGQSSKKKTPSAIRVFSSPRQSCRCHQS